MQDKRFQVFISSTYEDLKQERRAVEEVVITAGDFPVQMEAFPAADEDQFAFIKSLIDTCDYYVLIIAGRYGTKAEDGASYTEKEYRYAVSKGVPVLVMLHKNRGSLPADKTEQTDAGKKKLEQFIEATKVRLVKPWETIGDLKLAVHQALDHAKATKPRVGWVRGDSVANIEALTELNLLRKENEKIKDILGQVEIDIPLPELPDSGDEIVIPLVPNHNDQGYNGTGSYGSEAKIKCSWIACFPIFYNSFSWSMNDWNGESTYHIDDDSRIQIGSALASEVSGKDTKDAFGITKNIFATLINYYIEIGFMRPEGAEEPFTEAAKRFARRQSITNMSSASEISLIAGEITINSLEANASNLDDEIPF